MKKAGLQGRGWFSQALIFDEIYDFLQELAMLDTPNKAKAGETNASGQTPNAGWANRLTLPTTVRCDMCTHLCIFLQTHKHSRQ